MNVEDAFTKLTDKLKGWGEHLVLLLPNLIVAMLALTLFWLVARLIKKFSHKLLNRIWKSHQVNWLISIALYIATLVSGLVVALGILGLNKTVTSLLAGAGIIGLAAALAFQDIGQNLIASLYLGIRRTLKVGDIIETNGLFGTVSNINLRSTHIQNPQGQRVVIPNKKIFDNALTNYSTGRRRVDLTVGISYGDNLGRAKKVAIKAVEDIPQRMRKRDVELYYKEFGDSSINFVIRFWIDYEKQSDFLEARSEAIQRIKSAFDAEGITIPFPIRTLDFGEVGGERLSETLEHTGLAKKRKKE